MTDDDASAADRVRGNWLWLAIAAVTAVALVVAVVLLLQRPDDRDVLGPSGSQAQQIRAELSSEMDCVAGQLTTQRAVLACVSQDDEDLQLVFVQSNPHGVVASYTVETVPLHGEAHDGHVHGGDAEQALTLSLADRVAQMVTPGQGFAGCTYDRSTPFYCFGEVAAWTSGAVEPVSGSGASKRLPSIDKLDAALGDAGWSCDFGICAGSTSLTIEHPGRSLGLRYAAPVVAADVSSSVQAVLAQVPDTPQLREWAAGGLGDGPSIHIADGFVAGYLPQAGGGGLFVLDEVAGVLATTL